MDLKQKKEADKQFRQMSSTAKESDIKKIDSKLGGMKKGKLAENWDKVVLLWNFVKDPNAPWASKAIAVGALLYAISPIDAIPDFIPAFGLIDDVGIVLTAIASLGSALNKYKK